PDHSAAAAQSGSECHESHAGAPLDRTSIRARLRMPALLPFENLRSAADAVVEAVIRVGNFVAELLGHVLQDEVDRIHPELVRNVVHHRLDAEAALRVLAA